jgi:hypothetical protein
MIRAIRGFTGSPPGEEGLEVSDVSPPHPVNVSSAAMQIDRAKAARDKI